MQDYYKILGVQHDAEDVVIKGAFQYLSNKYHPDKYAKADAAAQEQALRRMQEISEAYTVLSDTVKRKAWDEEWRREMGAPDEDQQHSQAEEPRAKEPDEPADDVRPEPSKPSYRRRNPYSVLPPLPTLIAAGLVALLLVGAVLHYFHALMPLLRSAMASSFTALLFGVAIYGLTAPRQPKPDLRFKTGYKDNARPVSRPHWHSRLIIWPAISSFVFFLAYYGIDALTVNNAPAVFARPTGEQASQVAASSPSQSQEPAVVPVPAPSIETLPPRSPPAPTRQSLVTQILDGSVSNDEAAIRNALIAFEAFDKLPRGNRAESQRLVENGKSALAEQRFANAISYFRGARDADEYNWEAASELGNAYLVSDDVEMARQTAWNGLSVEPRNVSLWYLLTRVYMTQQQRDLAVGAFVNVARFGSNGRGAQIIKNAAEDPTDSAMRAIARLAMQKPAMQGFLAALPQTRVETYGAQPAPAAQSPAGLVAQASPPSPQESERTPEEMCSGRPNMISRSICLTRECDRPEKKDTLYCTAFRARLQSQTQTYSTP